MTQHPPITTASDWKTLPFPEQYITLALDFSVTGDDAVALRQGLMPRQMEDKWFFYFVDNTLFQHRSWTGNCIAQVHFVAHEEGLRATHAEVNRDPEQYTNTDDAVDVERIESLTRYLIEHHRLNTPELWSPADASL